MASTASDRAAVRRIRVFSARSDDLVVAETPELELEGRLGAVAETPDRLDARAVEPEDRGLALGRERSVGHQHVTDVVVVDGLGVEGFVGEGAREGGTHFTAASAIDGDDSTITITAHQQELDACGDEGITHCDEILDHRLTRREMPCGERVLALAQHEIVTIEARAAIGRADQQRLGQGGEGAAAGPRRWRSPESHGSIDPVSSVCLLGHVDPPPLVGLP